MDPLDNPARLLPLTNPFIFSSFLILANLFSSNTPILLLEYIALEYASPNASLI